MNEHIDPHGEAQNSEQDNKISKMEEKIKSLEKTESRLQDLIEQIKQAVK
ncbi:MAG: hypothetical protein ACLFR1_09555 [Spirochaetia bacterium]